MTHRIEEVVARGMCIGCGACTVVSQGAIRVSLGTQRLYQADLSGVGSPQVRAGSRVCPFSDDAPNEDALGVPHGDETMPTDRRLGTYSRTFAGRVNDDAYLAGSSSGGLTSWLVSRLLDAGMVDAVINVGRPGPADGEFFGYGVSEEGGTAGRRKSHYYATTMAEVLQAAKGSDLRYAIVGIPCYIKAARALCLECPELAERLVFFVGLVCGHFKTQAFAESLAWQLGVPPSELVDVDFRIKDPTRPSSDYDFGALRSGEDTWRHKPTRKLVGGSWGHNAFQPEACNFCDDVLAETADVSFGDAWLPQFTGDSRGTNVVVCRNRELEVLFDDGSASGQITVIPLSADDVALSQGGGLRHRREGTSVRLADDIASGLSVPNKRVEPDANAVSPRRAELLRQRRRMAARSHTAFDEAIAAGDLSLYLLAMRKEILRYRKLEAPLINRILRGGKRLAVVLLGRGHVAAWARRNWARTGRRSPSVWGRPRT